MLLAIVVAGCESPPEPAPAAAVPPPSESAPTEPADAAAGTDAADSTLSALQRAARAAREAEEAKPKIEVERLEPLQRAPSVPTRIATDQLGEYIGSNLQLQLRDGKTREGILESVRGGVAKFQQTVGSGTITFSVPVTSIKTAMLAD
jgi:hypothetical protein